MGESKTTGRRDRLHPISLDQSESHHLRTPVAHRSAIRRVSRAGLKSRTGYLACGQRPGLAKVQARGVDQVPASL